MFLMLRAKALTWRSQNRLNCKDRLKNGRDTQTIVVKVAVVRVARHRNRKSQFFSYQRAVFCKRRPWCSPLDYTKKILQKKCQSSLSGLHSFFSGVNFRPVPHFGKHRMCSRINLALVLLVTKLTKPSVWTQNWQFDNKKRFSNSGFPYFFFIRRFFNGLESSQENVFGLKRCPDG